MGSTTMKATQGLAVGIAFLAIACSNATSSGDSQSSDPSVKLTQPHDGDSFALTDDSMDIDVDFDVRNFDLVPLGQEGTDSSKGQVRLYVDVDLCNDPGEMSEPAVPYNRIWPNAAGEKRLGMDYCFGAPTSLANTSHVLKAQLWHGGTALTQSSATHEIHFKTTYSADGGAMGTDGGQAAVDSAVAPADDAAK
jgi:hypothetical protein